VADKRESVVFRRRLCAYTDVIRAIAPDPEQMPERFAVVFRVDSSQAAGALEVEDDRLSLRGSGNDGGLELEIPISALTEVRVGRRASERLNGYPTLILERTPEPLVQVAPFGMTLLPEIANLLTSLNRRAGGDVLTVSVPLTDGCLARAHRLLAKGPPFDPGSLGLNSHEVYLREGEAVFVFRGPNVRTRIGRAIRQPAVWQAGLAWHRCFAAPPQIVEFAELSLDSNPAYRWIESEEQGRQ
jgi:hypothetical protein